MVNALYSESSDLSLNLSETYSLKKRPSQSSLSTQTIKPNIKKGFSIVKDMFHFTSLHFTSQVIFRNGYIYICACNNNLLKDSGKLKSKKECFRGFGESRVRRSDRIIL